MSSACSSRKKKGQQQILGPVRQRRVKADDEIGATALGDLEEADEDGDRCLEGTEVARGGRFIRWNLTRLPEEDKKQDYTDVMMQKIRGNVQTSFFILYAYAIRLKEHRKRG